MREYSRPPSLRSGSFSGCVPRKTCESVDHCSHFRQRSHAFDSIANTRTAPERSDGASILGSLSWVSLKQSRVSQRAPDRPGCLAARPRPDRAPPGLAGFSREFSPQMRLVILSCQDSHVLSGVGLRPSYYFFAKRDPHALRARARCGELGDVCASRASSACASFIRPSAHSAWMRAEVRSCTSTARGNFRRCSSRAVQEQPLVDPHGGRRSPAKASRPLPPSCQQDAARRARASRPMVELVARRKARSRAPDRRAPAALQPVLRRSRGGARGRRLRRSMRNTPAPATLIATIAAVSFAIVHLRLPERSKSASSPSGPRSPPSRGCSA